MSDYLFDKHGDDAEVAQLERVLAPFAHDAPLRPLPTREPRRRPLLAALALAAGLVAILVWTSRGDRTADHLASGAEDGRAASLDCRDAVAGFAFAVDGGDARCAGRSVGAGVLPVGAWLETPRDSSTRLEVADIGQLTVHGASRMRLIETGEDAHRLQLARGRVSAAVLAPPRLFMVDTPAATAVDLGCAYELTVDERDLTYLSVTSGEVSLEDGATTAWVPAGSEVVAVPGRGPGTPVAQSAGVALRDAVSRFDAGEADALTAVLTLATAADFGTLYSLLLRTHGDTRRQVLRTLDALHPYPRELDEAALLAGDPVALRALQLRLLQR